MARSTGEIGPKTEELALHIARGLSVREAATKANVAYRTAQRRANDPRFLARVQELRSEVIGSARNRLVGALHEAIDKLRELLGNSDANIQLRAADKLIAHYMRLDEHADLVERLERLETILQERERTR